MTRLIALAAGLALVGAALVAPPADAFEFCKPIPGGGDYCIVLPDPGPPPPPPELIDVCDIKPELCEIVTFPELPPAPPILK